MIYIFLGIYIFFTAFSLLYIKKDKLPNQTDYVIILSGFSRGITKRRILKGLEIGPKYPKAIVIFCGKEKEDVFMEYKESFKNHCLINNKSTNTYEDAYFNKQYLKNKGQTILITSSVHQRRAFNTFRRVYEDMDIYNLPTSDLLTWYSPLLPSGWIATIMNLIKDWKYNKKR